jgi:hypothetical protein
LVCRFARLVGMVVVVVVVWSNVCLLAVVSGLYICQVLFGWDFWHYE